jgi:hypothetical protein
MLNGSSKRSRLQAAGTSSMLQQEQPGRSSAGLAGRPAHNIGIAQPDGRRAYHADFGGKLQHGCVYPVIILPFRGGSELHIHSEEEREKLQRSRDAGEKAPAAFDELLASFKEDAALLLPQLYSKMHAGDPLPGPYMRIGEKLGEGGQAPVYLAQPVVLGRDANNAVIWHPAGAPVALKLFLEPVLPPAEDEEKVAQAEKLRQRHELMVNREIKVNYALSSPLLASWSGMIALPLKRSSGSDKVEVAYCGLMPVAEADLQQVLDTVSASTNLCMLR